MSLRGALEFAEVVRNTFLELDDKQAGALRIQDGHRTSLW